jgi:hypothetical protein
MNIEKEILALQERNKRVEAGKAWETSGFRKLVIFVITYTIAAIWLYLVGDSNFILTALVPGLGWLLSTLTIPFVKKWWVKKYFK